MWTLPLPHSENLHSSLNLSAVQSAYLLSQTKDVIYVHVTGIFSEMRLDCCKRALKITKHYIKRKTLLCYLRGSFFYISKLSFLPPQIISISTRYLPRSIFFNTVFIFLKARDVTIHLSETVGWSPYAQALGQALEV